MLGNQLKGEILKELFTFLVRYLIFLIMENMKTVNHTLYIYKDGFLTADMLAASLFNVSHAQCICSCALYLDKKELENCKLDRSQKLRMNL